MEKMKNDATFVRMRIGDHLGDAKNVEKGHLAPSNLTFLKIALDRNGFPRLKEEGLIHKTVASDLLIFAQGLSYDLSKFSDDFAPFFEFERPLLSP